MQQVAAASLEPLSGALRAGLQAPTGSPVAIAAAAAACVLGKLARPAGAANVRWALVSEGPQLLPALALALRSPHAALAQHAAGALCELAAAGEPAMLQRMAMPGVGIIDALAAATQMGGGGHEGIGAPGAGAAAAQQALIHLANRGDDGVRRAMLGAAPALTTAVALAGAGAAAGAAEALVRVASCGDPDSPRAVAAAAFATLTAAPPALDDARAAVLRRAALARSGGALPALAAALASLDASHAAAAAAALCKLTAGRDPDVMREVASDPSVLQALQMACARPEAAEHAHRALGHLRGCC